MARHRSIKPEKVEYFKPFVYVNGQWQPSQRQCQPTTNADARQNDPQWFRPCPAPKCVYCQSTREAARPESTALSTVNDAGAGGSSTQSLLGLAAPKVPRISAESAGLLGAAVPTNRGCPSASVQDSSSSVDQSVALQFSSLYINQPVALKLSGTPINQAVASKHSGTLISETTQPVLEDSDILRIVTFNILFDRRVRAEFNRPTDFANTRFKHTIALLHHHRPHIICLQECTASFLQLLMNHEWVKSEYEVSRAVDRVDDVVIVSRIPFHRLRAYHFGYRARHQTNADNEKHDKQSYSLEKDQMDRQLKKDGNTDGTWLGKQFIIADFLIHGRVMSIANLHLSSDHYRMGEDGQWVCDTGQSAHQRAGQLSRIFSMLHCTGDDQFLMGDFNFNDGSELEEQALCPSFIDVWKSLNTTDPGFTADANRNSLTRALCPEQPPVRLDRILFRSDHWKAFRIHKFGVKPFRVIEEGEKEGDDHMFPSDHFGLVADFIAPRFDQI